MFRYVCLAICLIAILVVGYDVPVAETENAGEAQTYTIPYPVHDFSADTAYPVKRIGNLGNSIQIDMDGKLKQIRLIGVRGRGGGVEEFLKRLLLGEQVYLRLGSDGNKSWVYLFRAPDGLFVNLEMLRQGYGIVWTNPTFKFLDLFKQYESIAKVAEKGIWKPKPKEKKVETLWE